MEKRNDLTHDDHKKIDTDTQFFLVVKKIFQYLILNLRQNKIHMKLFFLLLAIHLYNFDLRANQHDGDIAFSTKKLEEVASLLSEKYLIGRDTMMICPEICENKSVVIQYNEKNQVSHLGISMFSREIKDLLNEPVCNFVERLLLELSLAQGKDEIVAELDHYGISMQRNGIKFGDRNVNSIQAILNEIEDPVHFTISKDDNSYTVAWEYGSQNLFVIQFPLSRELITGANKLEADNVLFDQLKANNCTHPAIRPHMISDAAELISNDGTVFVRAGDSFMLGMINENTYYKKAADGYELIFDENFPKESLSNLFHGDFENNALKIQVTHAMYGNYNPEFEMRLNDFICFFKQDFKVYTASYQKAPGVINATVIFQNKTYDYIHLLIISTKQENIFSANGILTASFRSNIPQHNINSIVRDIMNESSNY